MDLSTHTRSKTRQLANPLSRIQTHRTFDGEARDTLTNHRMSYPDASHPSTSSPAHSALRRGPRGPRRTPRVPAPPRPALAGVPSRVDATSRLFRGKPMTLPPSPPKWAYLQPAAHYYERSFCPPFGTKPQPCVENSWRDGYVDDLRSTQLEYSKI
jgi:hypothetical protein